MNFSLSLSDFCASKIKTFNFDTKAEASFRKRYYETLSSNSSYIPLKLHHCSSLVSVLEQVFNAINESHSHKIEDFFLCSSHLMSSHTNEWHVRYY